MTLRCVARTQSIIDSHGFVDSSVRRACRDPEPDHGERLLHSFAQRAGGAGVCAIELVGEPGELLERALIVGLSPRAAHPRLDRRAVALGEVTEDVAFSLIDGWMSSAVAGEGRSSFRIGGFGGCSVSFGAWLRTPCRWELSRLLNSLWAVRRPERNWSWPGQERPRRAGAKG